MHKIHTNKFYSDPAGITFLEWSGSETWPTCKSILNIKNYKTSGRKVEWLLFEPEKRINPVTKQQFPGEFYRIVDDLTDATYYKEDKSVTLVMEDSYKNVFGYVPGIVNSDLLDSSLEYATSPLNTVVELLDKFLRGDSVKDIFEFLHGYPIFWAYMTIKEKCHTCLGERHTKNGDVCGTCEGKGHVFKKDVTDGIYMKPPVSQDAPTIDAVAGYISADVETWREMRTELEWTIKLLNYTMWGTQQEPGGNNTATGEFINIQTVSDALNLFSDSFQDMEKRITKMMADFYTSGQVNGIDITYGRRYLIEAPDAVWKKYQSAKNGGAPKVTLNNLLLQYYQSEYSTDSRTLAIMTKAMVIEPFVHKSDEQVKALITDNQQVLKKIYFNEWFKTLTDDDVIFKSVEELDKQLTDYVLERQPSKSSGSQVGEGGQAIETPIDKEADAKAALKGSVGGVKGILAIQASVSQGITDYNAALKVLSEIFGFDESTGREILGEHKKIVTPNTVIQ